MAKPIASTPQLNSEDFLKLLKEDETPLTKLTKKEQEQIKKDKELMKNIRKKFTFGEGVSF